MSQPAKRKNTDSVLLSDLIGDDGELRYDAATLSEKPKRHAEPNLTETQIFLQRMGFVLLGTLGIMAVPLLLPYLPAVIVVGGAAYLLRQPIMMFLGSAAIGMAVLALFALRLALSVVATIVVMMLTIAAGQVVPSVIATPAGFILWAWVIGMIFGFAKMREQ